MDTSYFDEQGYRDQLIAGGIDPSSASSTARRTAAARALGISHAKTSDFVKPVQSELLEASTAIQEPTLTLPKVRRSLSDKITEAGVAIAMDSPTGGEMQFMHAIMCQVGLPRSKVDGTVFERKCGNAALSISAGKLWNGEKFVQQPIPYGTLPRLMLAWMNTYAVRNKTPVIPIGGSATEFLRMLGKDTNGGKRGSFTMFRMQMQALSACRMTLGFNANGKAYTYDGKPIKQFEAWLATNTADTYDQQNLWPGNATFSDDYYTTLAQHAVPIDVRAFTTLKGSALQMDIYTMLADRLHRISGKPILLQWSNLRDQFGQEYRGVEAEKNFKKKFLPALHAVLTVYPNAKVSQVPSGLLLFPSPPPIAYKR
jgi:hypothetical protein